MIRAHVSELGLTVGVATAGMLTQEAISRVEAVAWTVLSALVVHFALWTVALIRARLETRRLRKMTWTSSPPERGPRHYGRSNVGRTSSPDLTRDTKPEKDEDR